MGRVGPLLKDVLERIDRVGPKDRGLHMLGLAAHLSNVDDGEQLPLVVQLEGRRPRRGERWADYKKRVGRELHRMQDVIAGGNAKPLYLANALAGSFHREQAAALAKHEKVNMVELDPVVNPTLMDDAVIDVGLDRFYNQNGRLTGSGIRVAVLDSGIDTKHPHLNVVQSISTCGEDIALPGKHGTHCAGSIASRDEVFRGIAPEVDLLNVKVLRANGSGQHTHITQGIDEALNLNADIISMSLGFNHLPAWSNRGHGWSSPDGRCPLCTAVDNAVSLGVIVVVAAGNESSRAETLRRNGGSKAFDTELCCPGQARGAITVGALTKRTFLPADFSSRGPTAFGDIKPDVAAPGVNIMSTVPAPRRPDGTLEPNPPRTNLFDRDSGTSMATPMVAAAAALLLQQRRQSQQPVTPAAIRQALLSGAVSPVTLPTNVAGSGRLDLAQYGVIVPTT